jgi:hypothetical protein
LLEAASNGDVAGVEQALASGACVDTVNSFGSTALICAEHVDVAKILIARGANLEHRAGWGLSAQHQAASWEQLEMVKEEAAGFCRETRVLTQAPKGRSDNSQGFASLTRGY